jgi:uncharacterized protein (DUF302 family)
MTGISDTMTVQNVAVTRVSVTSTTPFDTVVARIDAAVGHPDWAALAAAIAAAPSSSAVEALVEKATGASGLMEFLRLDLGEVLRKDRRGASARSLRFLIGNPVTMKQMAEHVPDAGSYAPVTILIDERQDGVHLSYDRMASLLAPYGSADALTVARVLDDKVERMLTAAAA